MKFQKNETLQLNTLCIIWKKHIFLGEEIEIERLITSEEIEKIVAAKDSH